MDPIADASLPDMRARRRPGMATAAMMPMIATTMSSSISVKPFWLRSFIQYSLGYFLPLWHVQVLEPVTHRAADANTYSNGRASSWFLWICENAWKSDGCGRRTVDKY